MHRACLRAVESIGFVDSSVMLVIVDMLRNGFAKYALHFFPLLFSFCFSIAEFVVSLWTWGGDGRLLK